MGKLTRSWLIIVSFKDNGDKFCYGNTASALQCCYNRITTQFVRDDLEITK